jgi:hypothetical protein
MSAALETAAGISKVAKYPKALIKSFAYFATFALQKP